MTLCDLGRHEDAVLCCDQALAIDPDYTPALHNKGFALWKLERYEEALISLDKEIQVDPADPEAWAGKAYTLNALGRYEEAVVYYAQLFTTPRETPAGLRASPRESPRGSGDRIPCSTKVVDCPMPASISRNKLPSAGLTRFPGSIHPTAEDAGVEVKAAFTPIHDPLFAIHRAVSGQRSPGRTELMIRTWT